MSAALKARLNHSMFTSRRAAAAVAALALGGAATILVVTSPAAASGRPNLAIRQTMSTGSTNGETTDTIRLHNIGSATATNVNVAIYLKTTASLGEHLVGTAFNCEIMPAVSGFKSVIGCQLIASLKARRAKNLVIELSGAAGTRFTSTATVGVLNQDDSNYSNNTSTRTSYFGPRAELGASGTAVPGSTTGTVKAVTTVVNHGPSKAIGLQLIVEIQSSDFQSVGATAPSTSCQIIPPGAGYQAAASCVIDSLGVTKKWVLTFTYTGLAGGPIVVKSTVSANRPADPVSSNNSFTKTTAFAS
jgi:Domain of unknown function DUF11